MLTPNIYGSSFIGVRMAYALLGALGNGAKFPFLAGATSEAGFMAGLFVLPVGVSNLPRRSTSIYSQPAKTNRFSGLAAPDFGNFVGIIGKMPACFPVNQISWNVFGLPANAT